jgi:sugar phosphate isomerase/epimerase
VKALDLLLESPAFALTFDIGHNHGIGGRDEGIILQRWERLRHFHFHDGVGKKNHLPLGAGEIDLEKYFALAEAQAGRIVLETKTVAGLKESVKWVRRMRSA